MTSPDEPTNPEDLLYQALSGADDALASGIAEAPPDELPAEVKARLDLTLPTLRLLQEEFGRPRVKQPSRPAQESPHDPDDGPGRYSLRKLHAMGGVGEVWLARDNVLGREVALKQLRPDKTEDGHFHGRLLQEARITSRLQHPGMVPVYELVEETVAGDPFFTMRYVRGRTLGEAIRAYHQAPRRGRTVELFALLNALVSACNTVAYAHSKGVIHRDLKTENVLVGDYGEVVVIDWGFAKVCGRPDDPTPDVSSDEFADPGQTVAGTAVGTPAYMAPEQAAGGRVDERSDIYGLGAILYEILTGRPPYRGDTAAGVLAQVKDRPPPPPGTVAKGVPPGLAAVCLKAMARDPDARYPTADALARDLQRWLADEPTTARREGPVARFARFARHHRQLMVGLAVLVLAAAAGAVALGWFQARAALDLAAADARGREEAERLRTQAEDQREEADRERYLSLVTMARRELEDNNPGETARLLERCPPSLRGWEWRCLRRLARSEPLTLAGHKKPVRAVAFRPGRDELASGGAEETVILWNLTTGRPRLTLAARHPAVTALAFSLDGSRLALAGADGRLSIRNAEDGTELLFTDPIGGRLERVWWGPNGRRLLTQAGTTAHLWDAEAGRTVAVTPPDWAVRSVLYAPDGRPLVLARRGGRWFVADVENLDGAVEVHDTPPVIRAWAYRLDGRLFAAAGGELAPDADGEIVLTDPATGREVRRFGPRTGAIYAVAFTPDGSRLAAGLADATVRVWDPDTGVETLVLHGHKEAVRTLAFAPDGRRLATAGSDGTVRVWEADPAADAPPRHQVRALPAGGHVYGVAWLPDGRRLASVGTDRRVSVWEVDAGRAVAGYPLPAGSAECVAVSPDGRWLAAGETLGNVYLLDADTGAVAARVAAHPSRRVFGVAFSPDGRRLASAGWDRLVQLWNVPGGEPAGTLKGHTQLVSGVAFHPDGRQVATASWDGSVRVWDADTGTERKRLTDLAGRCSSVAWSPDGRLLAAGGGDGRIQLWDTETWKPFAPLTGHSAAVQQLVFRSDCKYLASASSDQTARLWRTDSPERPRPVRTFRGHADQVRGVAFRPGGRHLTTAGFDGTIRIWDAAEAP